MMEKKRFAEAARILVAFGGSALIIDEAIGQDELVMVNELVHLFGCETLGDIQGTSFHVRINDPETQGFHRDYAVK